MEFIVDRILFPYWNSEEFKRSYYDESNFKEVSDYYDSNSEYWDLIHLLCESLSINYILDYDYYESAFYEEGYIYEDHNEIRPEGERYDQKKCPLFNRDCKALRDTIQKFWRRNDRYDLSNLDLDFFIECVLNGEEHKFNATYTQISKGLNFDVKFWLKLTPKQRKMKRIAIVLDHIFTQLWEYFDFDNFFELPNKVKINFTFTLVEKKQLTLNDDCAICLENSINENDNQVSMCNLCKKEFHAECIKIYSKEKCPMCRFSC